MFVSYSFETIEGNGLQAEIILANKLVSGSHDVPTSFTSPELPAYLRSGVLEIILETVRRYYNFYYHLTDSPEKPDGAGGS